MDAITDILNKLAMPRVTVTDVIEIVLIAFVIYKLLVWMRDTRTWFIVKGAALIFAIIGVSYIFSFDTILFLAQRAITIIIIAFVIIFQPELRRALEKLGQRNVLLNLFSTRKSAMAGFTMACVEEIVEAAFELARTRTGALIVIEREVPLEEYIKTGISMDAVVTRQLLLNIFGHNTPLHDGAVIIKGDRIESATCYLPLSNSREISKTLGTRHRAALGVSEQTDSATVIVSEETGYVSLAYNGSLRLNVRPVELKQKLSEIMMIDRESGGRTLLERIKGGKKNEKDS